MADEAHRHQSTVKLTNSFAASPISPRTAPTKRVPATRKAGYSPG
jgi:hypothetical protein